MFPEIALHILDIAENSVRADAALIEISVNSQESLLTVVIKDNGCGMSPEMTAAVTDPFITSRTTRRVGLGIPFFKLAAEMTGGSFSIISKEGAGTAVTAVFHTDHIDCMPLGDLAGTILALITLYPNIDFAYTRTCGEKSLSLDTAQFREVLAPVPLNDPEVGIYIRDYLEDMEREIGN